MKPNAARKANRSKPSILFVDDEQRVLNSMRALFRRDYNLFLTTRGDEALKIIDQNDIDVVVADQRMPIMTGVEILSRVKVSSPNTIRILLTGYANATAIEAAINSGEVYKFLNKPCPVEELRGTIRQAADIATVTAQKNSENYKQQVAAQNFTNSMKDVRVKPSLAERLNRIMEAVNTRKKNGKIESSGPIKSGGELISKEEPDAKDNMPLPSVSKPMETIADTPAKNQDGDHTLIDAIPKSTDDLDIKTAQSESAHPIANEFAPEEVNITATGKPSRNEPMRIAAREHEKPVGLKIGDVSSLETKKLLNAVDSGSGALLSAGKKPPALNAESAEPADTQSISAPSTPEVQKSNTISTTRRMTVDDDSVDTESNATKLETIKLEFDLIGKDDEDESMLSEFVEKALSPRATDTTDTNATAESGSDNEQSTSTNDHNLTAAPYSQLNGAIHAIPPGLSDRISAKISRSIASKPKSVVPTTKIPALSPEPFVDENVDENLFSESVTEKRSFPVLTVPGHITDKENAKAAANEKFDSVEITLGGNTHEIVDLTHSVEIIMSGDTHRIRGSAEESLGARTDMTLPGGMGGFGNQHNEAEVPSAEAELSDETIGTPGNQSLADENRRMRVVGTGKYRISIIVFSSDKAFAKSVGRSLHGFFYTFHATTIEQLTYAIKGVDPAVLITDVSTEPDFVQELVARFKQQVPELVTMVASQHRDADLMIKLINYGQVFRMVDKPMSPTACKMYVREALKRHLQLRKNPELVRQHVDRKIEGESKLPSNINRLISGLKLGRVRRLLGR